MELLGIDIGGSGIKGAPVDRETGALLAPRFRLATPEPAKPPAVAEVVKQVVEHFDWKGPIGCGFPGVIIHGVTLTAVNIHKQWVGLNAAEFLTQATGCPTCMVNDADAAGLAEMAFGAGKDRMGVVWLVTIGTGLGTALFTDGHLLPNCEFGHMKIRGVDAEWRASDAARQRDGLSWKKWAGRFNEFLQTMEYLVWPDLIILGGGVSKEHEKFFPYLEVRAELLPAQMLNEAGIVGAALAARCIPLEE